VTPEIRGRFEHEARVVAGLSTRAWQRFYDSGEIEGGALYIVMERLLGSDLETLLARRGAGTPREVARLARQAASALGAAHDAGSCTATSSPRTSSSFGAASNSR